MKPRISRFPALGLTVVATLGILSGLSPLQGQTVNVSVPGSSDIFGAGHATPPAGWLAFTTVAAAGITSYLNQPDWLAAAGGTNALTVFSNCVGGFRTTDSVFGDTWTFCGSN